MKQTQLPELLLGRIRAQWAPCDSGMFLNMPQTESSFSAFKLKAKAKFKDFLDATLQGDRKWGYKKCQSRYKENLSHHQDNHRDLSLEWAA